MICFHQLPMSNLEFPHQIESGKDGNDPKNYSYFIKFHNSFLSLVDDLHLQIFAKGMIFIFCIDDQCSPVTLNDRPVSLHKIFGIADLIDHGNSTISHDISFKIKKFSPFHFFSFLSSLVFGKFPNSHENKVFGTAL